jgi:hypothetical protein
MKTATTIARTGEGWVLLSGPDKPADKQREAFNNVGLSWPKDVSEIRFQFNNGLAKIKIKAKAIIAAQQMSNAAAKVAEKQAIAERLQAESQKADEAKQSSQPQPAVINPSKQNKKT